MKMFVWFFSAVTVLLAIVKVMIFNKLVCARNQAKNGFAQIEVQHKRWHDLIPNLVGTAKRYLTHETVINVMS